MVLYGIGGHAKAIYDCLKSQGQELAGAFDDDPAKSTFMDLAVSPYSSTRFADEHLIISIGDNATRRRVSGAVKHIFGKVIHHAAYIASGSEFGVGSVVMVNATIQAEVEIGTHCVINSASIIEHDCKIEDFAHIGPGAVVCGDVKVSEGALIGANATILPGIHIGSWSVIGAGAVVTRNVPDGETVIGVPARSVES